MSRNPIPHSQPLGPLSSVRPIASATKPDASPAPSMAPASRSTPLIAHAPILAIDTSAANSVGVVAASTYASNREPFHRVGLGTITTTHTHASINVSLPSTSISRLSAIPTSATTTSSDLNSKDYLFLQRQRMLQMRILVLQEQQAQLQAQLGAQGFVVSQADQGVIASGPMASMPLSSSVVGSAQTNRPDEMDACVGIDPVLMLGAGGGLEGVDVYLSPFDPGSGYHAYQQQHQHQQQLRSQQYGFPTSRRVDGIMGANVIGMGLGVSSMGAGSTPIVVPVSAGMSTAASSTMTLSGSEGVRERSRFRSSSSSLSASYSSSSSSSSTSYLSCSLRSLPSSCTSRVGRHRGVTIGGDDASDGDTSNSDDNTDDYSDDDNDIDINGIDDSDRMDAALLAHGRRRLDGSCESGRSPLQRGPQGRNEPDCGSDKRETSRTCRKGDNRHRLLRDTADNPSIIPSDHPIDLSMSIAAVAPPPMAPPPPPSSPATLDHHEQQQQLHPLHLNQHQQHQSLHGSPRSYSPFALPHPQPLPLIPDTLLDPSERKFFDEFLNGLMAPTPDASSASPIGGLVGLAPLGNIVGLPNISPPLPPPPPPPPPHISFGLRSTMPSMLVFGAQHDPSAVSTAPQAFSFAASTQPHHQNNQHLQESHVYQHIHAASATDVLPAASAAFGSHPAHDPATGVLSFSLGSAQDHSMHTSSDANQAHFMGTGSSRNDDPDYTHQSNPSKNGLVHSHQQSQQYSLQQQHQRHKPHSQQHMISSTTTTAPTYSINANGKRWLEASPPQPFSLAMPLPISDSAPKSTDSTKMNLPMSPLPLRSSSVSLMPSDPNTPAVVSTNTYLLNSPSSQPASSLQHEQQNQRQQQQHTSSHVDTPQTKADHAQQQPCGSEQQQKQKQKQKSQSRPTTQTSAPRKRAAGRGRKSNVGVDSASKTVPTTTTTAAAAVASSILPAPSDPGQFSSILDETPTKIEDVLNLVDVPADASQINPDDQPSQQQPSKRRQSKRELLTEDEKRYNHVISEQKRRNLIRIGFQTLVDLTPYLANSPPVPSGPGNTGGAHSKSSVLFKAADYIRELRMQVQALSDQVRSAHSALGLPPTLLQEALDAASKAAAAESIDENTGVGNIAPVAPTNATTAGNALTEAFVGDDD